MKTYRKIIAILLAVGLVLPGAGLVAMADTVETNVTRLSGETRYETAVEVSKKAYATANAVVLAGGLAEVDALTGTLLASAKNAPLLYTHKDTLTPVTKARIVELKAKTVYILGGEDVVSADVEKELKALDITVERVSGENRYETAAEVAKHAETTSDHAFIVVDGVNSALVDALAIGPVSHVQKDPVLLVSTNSVPAATEKALKDLGIKTFTIIGGEKVVSKTVEAELKKLATLRTRVAGDNRDETAIAIATRYFPTAKQAVVVNGYGTYLADALVGGYLGGMKKAPILYARTNALTVKSAAYLVGFEEAYLLGGETVATKALENEVESILAPLTVDSVTAITKTVNQEGSELEFAINGQTVAPDKLTMSKLKALGYKFEFMASTGVFPGEKTTSSTGDLRKFASTPKFTYQVKVLLDNKQVAISNVLEVEVKDPTSIVNVIDKLNLKLNDQKLEKNIVSLTDDNLTLEVLGKTKDKKAIVKPDINVTELVSFESSKNSIATVELVGKEGSKVANINLGGATGLVTITVKGQNISKTMTFEVVSEDRVASAKNSNISLNQIKDVTGKKVEFEVHLKDNFGENILGRADQITFAEDSVVASTSKDKHTTENPGVYVVTATLHSDKAPLTTVNVKLGTLKLGEIKVTVLERTNTPTQYKATADKLKLDLFETGEKTVIKIQKMDKNGYLVVGGEINLSTTNTVKYSDKADGMYFVKIADEEVVKLSSNINLVPQKVGKTTVTVYEVAGATELNRGSFEIEVVNTKPVLSEAYLKNVLKVTEIGEIANTSSIISDYKLTGTGDYTDITLENHNGVLFADSVEVGKIILTTTNTDLKVSFNNNNIEVTHAPKAGVKADIEVTVVDLKGNVLDESVIEFQLAK